MEVPLYMLSRDIETWSGLVVLCGEMNYWYGDTIYIMVNGKDQIIGRDMALPTPLFPDAYAFTK